jgi:hypothetical protein
MTMKHKIDELARLETEARRLANSGAYAGFVDVRRELTARGHEGAWKIFKNLWTRAEINRLCDLARRAR